ncbi:methyltransferase regulatory domain protein [Acinetobacter sp. Ac_877]|uniref:class I SAM-dependent methyltransferase n=1 Tax=Acinetobacter portensis TaxID=1839785 RepID=UPI00128CD05F|nr:class I SAM-dependent methyltransferase [Acinetobacter portensis]MPW41340.1 methyltransferase regulatory domain protein [Acinetobacter portensis]
MTTNWTDGYQTEVNYTYGYYKDLSPNYQKFCLLLSGIDTPDNTEEQNHCELGFGQGVSLNIHAASNLGTFYGTDFNPAHAAHANILAAKAKTEHYLFDASFEELFAKDLPQFDSISLHGIWSWISHENQAIILKFIRKYLKPNGIVYISYNCLTGWAANMPIRELFHSHFKFNSKSLNPLQKVKDSLDFSEALLQQEPTFTIRNPNALQKVLDLKKQNPNYLIHEYLNQDWQCFSFQQVMKTLEDIKLSYASSSDLNVHLDNINFSEEHQQFINAIEHPIFKEQCRDYFANTQFRRDLFIRGKNTLPPLEINEKFKKLSFILLTSPNQIPLTINGYLGEFNLIQDIYKPISDCFLNNEYAPITVSQIESNTPELNYNQISNALIVLCHLGIVQPCFNEPTDQILKQSQDLNLYILEQASFHQNYQVLANPYSGIGIPIDHFSQLFYKAYFYENLKTALEFAQFTLKKIQNLNLFVLDENGEMTSDLEKSLIIIEKKAQIFIDSDKLKIAQKLKLFA